MNTVSKLKVLVVTTVFLAGITCGLRAESPVNPAAANNNKYYLVRQGDCLSKIAQKYGITVTELVRLNRLPNQNMLSIGQPILIKVGESVPASGQEPGKAFVGIGKNESKNNNYLELFVEKEAADADYPKIKDLNKKLNNDIQNAQYKQALETTEQILANVTKFKEKLTEVVEVLP